MVQISRNLQTVWVNCTESAQLAGIPDERSHNLDRSFRIFI